MPRLCNRRRDSRKEGLVFAFVRIAAEVSLDSHNLRENSQATNHVAPASPVTAKKTRQPKATIMAGPIAPTAAWPSRFPEAYKAVAPPRSPAGNQLATAHELAGNATPWPSPNRS